MITVLAVTLWLTASVPDKLIFPGYAPIPKTSPHDYPTFIPNSPVEYSQPTKHEIKCA